MPRGHPRRERPNGYHIIEACKKQPIQPIFRLALKRGRGIIHRGFLSNFDDLPYEIYLTNEADFVGSWIRIAGRNEMTWFISAVVGLRWKNKRRWVKKPPSPDHYGSWVQQVVFYEAYLHGKADPSRRYKYLLATPTRLIATAGDLDAVWGKTMLSNRQRKLVRRWDLIKSILPWATLDWVRKNEHWIPHHKPETWKMVRWHRVLGELVTGKRQRKHEWAPSPPKMGKGKKRPWHRRRWQKKPNAEEELAQKHDMGWGDLELIERIFGRKDKT